MMGNAGGRGKRVVERLEEIEAIARETQSQCRTWQWLKNFTALGVGGPVAAIIYPSTLVGAARLVDRLQRAGIGWRALGHGTNILASDELHDFVVISLRLLDERLIFEGERVRVHAGYSLSALVQAAADRGLSGLESLSGINGSVGGALRMRSTLAGHEIWQLVEEVWVADEGKVRCVPVAEPMRKDERTFLADDSLILAALLKLVASDREKIQAEMDRVWQERLSRQPDLRVNATRIFKDAPVDLAGQIIDRLGFRGKSCGGARVSERHAGFIVNEGGATAEDVFKLMDMIRKKAWQEQGIELEYGVEVWREEV